jgi:metal-responsive CopG/Arc/MetJ family transcriptional regulator
MRTTVSINEKLLAEAKRLVTGVSQSELIDLALASLVRETRRQQLINWVQQGRTQFSSEKLARMRRMRGRRSR